MRQVAVTEGDKVAAQIQFGYSVNGFGLGDLIQFISEVSKKEIQAKIEAYFADYEVIVTDANGCVTSDNVTIEVRADRNVYIPNTFRPEGFAPNNRFMLLTGTGVERLDFLTIFDRYGNPVFQVEDIPAPTSIDLGWDGRRGTGANSEVEAGVYVYLAEVTFIDNVTIQYSGSVTLIR